MSADLLVGDVAGVCFPDGPVGNRKSISYDLVVLRTKNHSAPQKNRIFP